MAQNNKYLDGVISAALKEDACRQDITTLSLISPQAVSQARIVFQEDGVVCGLALAEKVFKKLDARIRFVTYGKDGDGIKKNGCVALIHGKTRALLSGERVALNFLGYLSGIATNTRRYVEQVRGTKVKILDTRKTTPGLRELEKYAVRCGGGTNHRQNLSEMVLVKDNHLASAGLDFKEIMRRVRQSGRRVEVEVDSLQQLALVLPEKPDMVLLDNMHITQLRKAVKMSRSVKLNRPLLEASGGITLKNIRAVALTGVDRISIGALTHHHAALNLSMEITSS